MAAAQQDDRPSADLDPAHCRGAREYALRRLESADSAVSPAGLADEYGCSPSHMRTVLSSLAQQGEADREGRGQYVEPEEGTNENSVGDAGGADETPESTTNETEEDSMVTQAEYEAQHGDETDASPVGDAGDDVGIEVPDDDPDEETDLPAPALPMDPKTLGMILGAAIVLWFAYRSLGGSSSSGSDDGESGSSSSSSDEDGSDSFDLDGGLTS